MIEALRQHLDALRESYQDELDKAHEWETHYHEHHDEIHLAYFKGRTDALGQCLHALDSRIESASREA